MVANYKQVVIPVIGIFPTACITLCSSPITVVFVLFSGNKWNSARSIRLIKASALKLSIYAIAQRILFSLENNMATESELILARVYFPRERDGEITHNLSTPQA